MTSNNKPNKTK